MDFIEQLSKQRIIDPILIQEEWPIFINILLCSLNLFEIA
jgi:hypothetical protein